MLPPFILLLILLPFLELGWDVWKIWLPYYRATRFVTGGRSDLAIREFEKMIAASTLSSRLLQGNARFRLAYLLMDRGDYDAAVMQLEIYLKDRHKSAVEARVRERLAEALQGAGRYEEAASERERAAALLMDAAQDVDRHLTEANKLNHEQRFEEAYAAYERGLHALPAYMTEERARAMVQLGLMAVNCGKSELICPWAEKALATRCSQTIRMSAHSTAALGHIHLGRLEEGEDHRLQALEIAMKVGNRDLVADYMAQLAYVQEKRGRLLEAMQQCEKAKGLSVAKRRIIYTIQAECLKDWGRFSDALELFDLSRRAKPFPQPSAEARMQAAYLGGIAALKAELDAPSQALAYNQQALDGLQNDAKLTLQLQCQQVWYLALAGRHEEAVTLSDLVEPTLAKYPESRGTQISCLEALGRAYFVLGDYARSQQYWERYLTCKPDPVYLPKARYFRGECLEKQGDARGAEAEFRQAVETGLDTFYVTRAQQRLSAFAPMINR